MKTLKILSLLTLPLLLASCGPGVELQTQVSSAPARPAVVSFEKQLLQRVNRERTSRGLKPLSSDPKLKNLSRMHSRFLSRNQKTVGRKSRKIAHSGFNSRLRRAQMMGYDNVSEIVLNGWGTLNKSRADATVDGWLRSPTHRKAMLNKYFDKVGIGGAFDAEGGFYATGLLGYKTQGKPLKMVTTF